MNDTKDQDAGADRKTPETVFSGHLSLLVSQVTRDYVSQSIDALGERHGCLPGVVQLNYSARHAPPGAHVLGEPLPRTAAMMVEAASAGLVYPTAGFRRGHQGGTVTVWYRRRSKWPRPNNTNGE